MSNVKKHVSSALKRSSLVAAIILALIFAIAGPTDRLYAQESAPETAVISQENSLILLNLSTTKSLQLDTMGKPDQPLLNKTGTAVAYNLDKTLCLVKAEAGAQPLTIAQNVTGYVWYGQQLIYSCYQQGLLSYDPTTEKSTALSANIYSYYNLHTGSDGLIYAEKNREYSKEDGNYRESLGIVAYDPQNTTERLLIKTTRLSDESTDGLLPSIAGLSADCRYLYIWCGVHSGSTNTDGLPFGVYDLSQNTFTRYPADHLFLRDDPSNLAINPTDSSKIVLNNGGMREVYLNKNLVLADLSVGSVQPLLPAAQFPVSLPFPVEYASGWVAQSPIFTPDGKSLIYSAAPIGDSSDPQIIKWFGASHALYQLNLSDLSSYQLTDSGSFDLALGYSRNGQKLYFLRQSVSGTELTCALWQLFELKESCLLAHFSGDISLQ